MKIYVLDSNFFIQAHRVSYPLDIAYSFWNKVKQLAEEGKIISIDKVKNEIYKNEDSLKKWCVENLPSDFFKDISQVMSAYTEVIEWANTKSIHYTHSAMSEFLNADEADAFIVAYALANKEIRIVVTQEISAPSKRNKIKIPEACDALKVHYVNMIGMFRELRETF